MIKHSGEKEQFITGARREKKKGKGRYDLLPPRAIHRLALHYEGGAKIYGDRNWEQGLPLSSFIDSLLRHTYQVLQGMKDEDHMAAICWNAVGLTETASRIEEGLLPKELDDIGYFSSGEEEK